MLPMTSASKLPLVSVATSVGDVDRVDHDVDPDRRLLRLDELRESGAARSVRPSRCTVGIRETRRGDELLRVRGSYGVQGTVASYQPVLAGEIGCSRAGARRRRRPCASALRSIASSNACRSFALDASGVPTFAYGRLPTPFLLPMLMRIAGPAELVLCSITCRLEFCWSAGELRSSRRSRAPGCRPPGARRPRPPRRPSA